MNARIIPPAITNEPVLAHAPGSPERARLKAALDDLSGRQLDIPMYIGGQEVRTGQLVRMAPPHRHAHTLGHYHRGDATHVQQAIDAALAAKKQWAALHWTDRAAIFLKAADLISGPWRARMLAATMLCQSKTVYQAEIDAVCELADFWRFSVHYLYDIYGQQPAARSVDGVWNQLEYRPLEGFVFALTPFNFTAIAGNLPSAPAIMGNTVVWKPADSQVYSAWVVMEALCEAGLPAGVINLVYADGPAAGEVIFRHRDFAGLHFTGSTGVFRQLWGTIGQNIASYRSYPRIVGETGGKDFILAHPTADPAAVAVAALRGAFEFQGQKCSAASRMYLPESLRRPVLNRLLADLATIRMGGPEEFHNFVTAVIDERAFDKIAGYIDRARHNPDIEVLAGGTCDKSIGYFIPPTVLLSRTPNTEPMCEEIFGPVLTVYVYPDDQWQQALALAGGNDYALTGAVFARDRYAIAEASAALQDAAGNFYINDKPTGAVVNQQPFGGARGSGTNDKAGSALNLLRWASPRTIKETFVPPTDYRYPFMG